VWPPGAAAFFLSRFTPLNVRAQDVAYMIQQAPWKVGGNDGFYSHPQEDMNNLCLSIITDTPKQH